MHDYSTMLCFRKPQVEDGPSIWNLVKDSTLDLNSTYSYLMMCRYFADTCIIAEQEKEIVGFVNAFLEPDAKNTLFVWQVAVVKSQRGKGLAANLIKRLLQAEACKDVCFVEATVSPSNLPSSSLFCGLARDLDTRCEISECFSADLFPGGKHEEELLYRIGPF